MNTIIKRGCIGLVAVAAAIGLSGCASDRYGGGYSSFSLGVASYDRPHSYGYAHRDGRDFDGDGVPNWADRRPRNPWVD